MLLSVRLSFLVSSSIRLVVLSSSLLVLASSHLIINEVASKGTPSVGACQGDDWIELYYVPASEEKTADTNDTDAATIAFNLSQYIVHDDKGPNDADAFTFEANTTIVPGEYLSVLSLTPKTDSDLSALISPLHIIT